MTFNPTELAEEGTKFLEKMVPTYLHAHLIWSEVEGDKALFRTAYGAYSIPVNGGVEGMTEILSEVVEELEFMLPKDFVLKLTDDKLTILRARSFSSEDEEHLEILDALPTKDLTELDMEYLWDIMEPQGGRYRSYGFFRFDPALLEQNIFNCSCCGELWKSKLERPTRCPRCRNELIRRPQRPKVTQSKPLDTINSPLVKHIAKEPEQTTIIHSSVDSLSPAETSMTLRRALMTVLLNYDAAHLNQIRSQDENSAIIETLSDLQNTIVTLVKYYHPNLQIRTNSVRPIGNWPATAWVYFGPEDDNFVGKAGEAGIHMNFLFDADGEGVCLAIVPLAKEWLKRYGRAWPLRFKPLKEEIRQRLSPLKEFGFGFDDNAELHTVPNSPGDQMRKGIIVYKRFEMGSMPSDQDIERSVVQLVDAFRHILKGKSYGTFKLY